MASGKYGSSSYIDVVRNFDIAFSKGREESGL